jgi:hypothetical protein
LDISLSLRFAFCRRRGFFSPTDQDLPPRTSCRRPHGPASRVTVRGWIGCRLSSRPRSLIRFRLRSLGVD